MSQPAHLKYSTHIPLDKKFYGVKKALEILDEEFNEFALKKRNYQEFFIHYNKYFYQLDELFHTYVLAKSIEIAYPEGYTHPKELELKDLENQLLMLHEQITAVEKHIQFIPNHSFIMQDFGVDEEDGAFDPTSWLKGGEEVYYIQSSKKRKITDYQTYLNVKSRLTKGALKSDKNFINFVHINTVNKISSGPPINMFSDLSISNLEVNIYPQTLEDFLQEYPDSIRVKYGLKPSGDSDFNSSARILYEGGGSNEDEGQEPGRVG